ncbi:uncharacterized conserved protein [alpha proteobacterium U9-1i]|nr:uncharacterized conserved protein [alpha proteobacterium U9-1i]
MSAPDYRAWIGRSETLTDELNAAPLRGLAALLDYDAPPWRAGFAPPLAHWLYFLPTAAQHAIDVDGHPKRGGFLPPVELPRRMWAGGRLTFHAPLAIGARMERHSTIADVVAKSGASGDMVFVTVRHVVRVNGADVVTEEQDIVYRGAAIAPAKAAPPEARIAERERGFSPDPTMLFRFSALTFNAHRIHYDREYATGEEGYEGLVVHGPYIATALMDHAIRTSPDVAFASFQFRAQRPLFDGDAATLCRAGEDLWCRNSAGEITMTARINVA